MLPREQQKALETAMKGYRTPPRTIKPVLAEEFSWVSSDTMKILVKRKWPQKLQVTFKSGDPSDAYIITDEGIKTYNTFKGAD